MKIYFTEENKQEYFRCVNEIIDTNWWSDGKYTRNFEQMNNDYCGMESVALSNAGAALYMLYKYAGVKGKDVIIPGNTFWATASTAKLAGANVIYADCNKEVV